MRKILPIAVTCVLAATTLHAQIQATYLYSLSGFSGPLRYDYVHVRVDRETNETYVVYQNLVRIFSASGMETFSFGEDLDVGQILDIAVDPAGNVIVLSFKDSRSLVTQCNFRGVPVRSIEIKNLPEGLSFAANRMILERGEFYFATLSQASVIVTDSNGEFRRHIDFLRMLDVAENQGDTAEMSGFAVDPDGNIFFTISALFRVYKFSADGTLSSFGRSGSVRGRFGVVSGIASDTDGHLVVTDKLKSVVMVFDKDFNFVTEFGYRGSKPENLISPDDIAIDGKDRIYVSQGRQRGVSVFGVTHH